MTSIPAVSAIGIWTVYVYQLNGTLGGRSLTLPGGFETQIQEYILHFWTVIQSWIPYINRANHVIPALVKFIFIVMVLIGGYIFSRRAVIKNEFVEERNPARWMTVLFIFFVLYIGFHLAAYISSSAQPDAESRLFSPLYVAVLFLVTGIVSALQNTHKFSKIWKAGFVAGVLIFAIYFQVQTREYVQDMHANGRGYTSLQWKQSDLIREVKKIDPGKALVSNDAALVLFYTGRFPAQVAITDVVSGSFQPTDSTNIILFYPQEENVYGEKAYELFENTAEEYAVVFQDSDGGIYSEIIVK